MGRLLNFDEFDNNNFNESRRELVRETRTEVTRVVSNRVITLALTTSYLTEEEKVWLESFMKSNNLKINESSIAESLFGVLKKGVENVENSKIGKIVKDKIGKALDGAKSFANWAADLLSKAWDKMIGYFKEKYKKILDPLLKKSADEMKKIKGNIKNEIKSLKDTVAWWLKNGIKLFTDAIRSKFSSEIAEAVFTYDGDLLNELTTFNPRKMRPVWEQEAGEEGKDTGGTAEPSEEDKKITPDGEQNGIFSFMNKISKKIDTIPPFKQLAHVKEIVEAGSNKILSKFSEMTKSMGGPGVFEFAVMSTLIGVAVEQVIEKYGVKNLEDVLSSEFILRFIPGAPHLVTVVELLGIFIVATNILEAAGELETEVEGK